jgi:hypothetical protein
MPEYRRAGIYRNFILGAILGAALPAAAVHASDEGSAGCAAEDGGRIGALRLQGLGATRPEVVLRELVHREGAAFSCDSWFEERKRLEDLDIFADVRLRTERMADSASEESPGWARFRWNTIWPPSTSTATTASRASTRIPGATSST